MAFNIKQEINYGRLCFAWIVGMISFLLFFSILYVSILYVSISPNLGISETAENYFMCLIWMVWNYIIPLLGCIFSILAIIFITLDAYFEEDSE